MSRWLDVDADGGLEPRGDPAIAASKSAVKRGPGRSVEDPVTKRTVTRVLGFLPLGFMAAVVFVSYAAIVWTLRRGFDWTDEAFVYAMIASNRMTIGEPWGFQYLLHPLYMLTGESVFAFRIVRLVGYVLLSVALVWCARAVMRRIGISIPRSGWAFILLLAQVGTFFAWSYPPRYLSYNEVSSWLAQLGVGLIVVSLAWGVSSPHDQRARWVLWPIWVGLGAVTTLLMFTKVTSGVALGAILALTLVIPNPNLRLWKRVVAVGAGTATVLLSLWVCQYPMGFYLKNAFDLLFDKSAQDAFGHPISGMIHTYVGSVLSTGYALLPAVLIFILVMATFRWKGGSIGKGGGRGAIDWLTWILGGFLLVALFALPKVNLWPYLGELVVFIGAAGIIGLIILGAGGVTLHGSAVRRSFSVAIGGSAIVAAPFISSLGTSNAITAQFTFAATLWAVVLGIALGLLTQRAAMLRSRARSLPALIGCVVILLAALAVKAEIEKPYRSTPLLAQNTSTSIPELRGLLLTGTEAAWIDWVFAAGESLGAQDVPTIAIPSAGALYAFNHSGYADPWLSLTMPSSFISLRLACTMNQPSDLIVLQAGTSTENHPSTLGLTKSLAACGINFPGDFQVVGRRNSEDPSLAMTIWRLKSRGLVGVAHGPVL